MKAANTYRHIIRWVLLSLLATSVLLLAAPTKAQAQASDTRGFEVHGGFGYMAAVFSEDTSFTHHGINFTLSAGYRWGWIAAYVDQTLAGVFYNKDVYGASFSSERFVGSTIVSAKYFFDVSDKIELWGQSGIGVTYLKNWTGFGLKLGAGAGYKITNRISIGGDFTYTLGVDDDGEIHLPAVSAHVRFRI